MFTEHGFEAMAQRIARLNNLPIELARNYTARIGDTPEPADDDERVFVVRDRAGREIARVRIADPGK